MTGLTSFFLVLQAVGAGVGVISAVWAEFAYVRAMRDGRVDAAERLHLDTIALGLRYGMLLLLVSSLSLVILAYGAGTAVAPATTSGYWSFMALALLVIVLASTLSRRRLSFSLASAAIFTGWWFLLYIALGRLPAMTFGGSVALFLIAATLLYGVLYSARIYAAKPLIPKS
jgi:hypothetical protein